MKAKTVITQWVHPEIIDYLSPVTDIIANTQKEPWTRDQLMERVKDAQAVMVFMPDMVDDAFLNECPDLKIVSAALKGYDNFDVAACTRRNIWFSMVKDKLTIPTAELAVGLMIGLGRHIRQGDERVRSGQFSGWRPVLYGTGLDRSCVGIIGMGAVGKAISRALAGFDAKIIYHDPTVDPSTLPENVFGKKPESVSLATLAQESNYLVSATPYSAATHHMVNAELLAQASPSTLLINIGRGSCVDETAVAKALEENRLAGYAADVFEFEDWARKDRPQSVTKALLASDKTLFTPHIGSAVNQVRFEIAMEAAENIHDFFSGKNPRGAINQIEIK